MNLADITERLNDTASDSLRGLLRYAPDDEGKLAELNRVLRDAEELAKAAKNLAKTIKAKRDEEAAWLATKAQLASVA